MSGIDIDYANDWSGECRMDPEDGNAYVLRTIELTFPSRPESGFTVMINDIMGGHVRYIDADDWVKWIRVAADATIPEQ